MPHIAVVVHEHGSFDDVPYFLFEMAVVWRESGLQVSVVRGSQTQVQADVAVLHVDVTVVPEDHLAFVRNHAVAINGNVADISKRRISSNLVCPGDGYDGPVIVKTDRNWGGIREAKLAARGLMPKGFACLPTQYMIRRSPAEVPSEIWRNKELIVERFLPEMREGCFCLRTWVFMGDKETNSLVYSKNPIVKADSVIRRDVVNEVPDELRQMRRDLSFDYGKFDYVIRDGRVILYDVNRTPALGQIPRDQFTPRIRLLAEGIRAFI
jgi:hypothetical protein